MSIGVTAIAAYIGAGGLGTFISRGIAQSDPRQLVTGAVAVSVLAIAADLGLAAVAAGADLGGDPVIRLEEVTKTFGAVTAVDRITLEVPEGEICVLLGPSGCGKTTTMRMINRLIEPSSGRILIGGEDVTHGDPVLLRRRIGYVIQQIGLFPNKTIVDNICTVPDLMGKPRRESRARAVELLEMVALDPAVFLQPLSRASSPAGRRSGSAWCGRSRPTRR